MGSRRPAARNKSRGAGRCRGLGIWRAVSGVGQALQPACMGQARELSTKTWGSRNGLAKALIQCRALSPIPPLIALAAFCVRCNKGGGEGRSGAPRLQQRSGRSGRCPATGRRPAQPRAGERRAPQFSGLALGRGTKKERRGRPGRSWGAPPTPCDVGIPGEPRPPGLSVRMDGRSRQLFLQLQLQLQVHRVLCPDAGFGTGLSIVSNT